jgi:hypothetical protein
MLIDLYVSAEHLHETTEQHQPFLGNRKVGKAYNLQKALYESIKNKV